MGVVGAEDGGDGGVDLDEGTDGRGTSLGEWKDACLLEKDGKLSLVGIVGVVKEKQQFATALTSFKPNLFTSNHARSTASTHSTIPPPTPSRSLLSGILS